MEQHTIRSVGIDIGTTTTQLVFSLLKVVNAAGPTQVPRYSIIDREIVYESPVIFTPHLGHGGDDTLDASALAQEIARWYQMAGLRPEDVPVGAAIITGESLKARNSRDTVMQLTQELGDFVVATAGPHLESIIAGRGSGAAALAAKGRKTVLNIDIGGGTSNYAIFHNDCLVETACVNIGGRLIETTQDGGIVRVHAPAQLVANAVLGTGTALTSANLHLVLRAMADILYDLARGRGGDLARQLLQTPPLSQNHHYDAVVISGGVGYCLRQSFDNMFCFGDVGPLLAHALLQHEGFASMPQVEASSTVRATVIGAGAWALSLSGATVWAEDAVLPLKNIPIIPVVFSWELEPGSWVEMFEMSLRQRDIEPGSMLFALGVKSVPPTYRAVTRLADQISCFWHKNMDTSRPLVVIFEEDVGKVVGMELKDRLPDVPIIVLDEIQFLDGDYIDIGNVQRRSSFLPVVIKSLAFPAG